MRRVSVLAPLVAFGCMLLQACERRPAGTESPVVVDTLSSGAIVVRNSGPGRWAGGGGWRIEEVLRIGELEGDDVYVIGRIGALEVDAAGNIHVFDQHANELRTFSPRGEHLRTVGREGSGPGEFRGVVGMAAGPDGRLVVVDGSNARYTVVDGRGGMTSIPRPSRRVLPPWVGGFDADGRFYDLATQSVDGELVDMLLQVSERGDVIQSQRIPRLEAQVIRLNGDGASTALPYAAKVLSA
ncbi:MAG: 6-bladed beta-propeller [Gemmatimonadota bacterium]